MAACGDDTGRGSGGSGGSGGAGGAGGSGGMDAAPDGVPGDGGGLPFGANCTANDQCASNLCFMGGTQSYCSQHCTSPADCPPQATGCNMMGFCRRG